MIDKRSRSIEWITEAASRIGVHDVALVEKTIRAFSLLEALARSGCPFIFKGGSSLMPGANPVYDELLAIELDNFCNVLIETNKSQNTFAENLQILRL